MIHKYQSSLHTINTYTPIFLFIKKLNGIGNGVVGRGKSRIVDNPYYNVKGVDLNRNFGLYWGTEGSSRSPCSQVYAVI